MVSSSSWGPRGLNGASPFMYANPERDIDSAPQAIPTPRSPALIACAIMAVALSDDPQNLLMVAPAARSGKPAASAAPAGEISHAFMRGVHTSGDDVFDLVAINTDAFAGPGQGQPGQ